MKGSEATAGKGAVQAGPPTPGPTGTSLTKRKRKGKKTNKRKEKTKDDPGSKERKGKERPGATSVAPAPSDDLELDDGWADEAVRAPPLGLATLAEPRATATAGVTTKANFETIAEALELDSKGSFLKTGGEATLTASSETSG